MECATHARLTLIIACSKPTSKASKSNRSRLLLLQSWLVVVLVVAGCSFQQLIVAVQQSEHGKQPSVGRYEASGKHACLSFGSDEADGRAVCELLAEIRSHNGRVDVEMLAGKYSKRQLWRVQVGCEGRDRVECYAMERTP